MELRELLSDTICALAGVGIENANFEARQILEKAGIPAIKIISEPKMAVPSEIVISVNEMTKKRVSGFPLQYILGEWEFYGLPFWVGEGVLIPRQDTETLVETAGDFLKTAGQSAKILDLCAGSGCIGITLAKLFGAEAVLLEKSEKAFSYLEKNIARNSVKAHCKAVLGDALDEKITGENFDAIVSNPPYLTKKDMENLQTEVTFEPYEALYGGEDGLLFYRGLLRIYAEKLKNGGLFAVEIGLGQEAAVGEIFRENGIMPRFEKDMRGMIRVVYGVK